MHALGDLMAPALEHHPAAAGKWMPTFVPSSFSSTMSERPQETPPTREAEMLVVVGAARAEQVRRAGVLREIVTGTPIAISFDPLLSVGLASTCC